MPAGPGSARSMPTPFLPGNITAEEFEKYSAFQQKLNDDPKIKELNAQIADHLKEVRRLQANLHAARDQAMLADPEIKAIRDKLMSAAHSPGGGPGSPPAFPLKTN